MITDELIRQFIDGLNEDYTFSEADIKYVSNYSGCHPSVPSHIAKKAKDAIYEKFPSIKEEDVFGENRNFTMLTVGFGADKILCGNTANETSFQNEYYCYAISRALNQKKFLDGTYKLRFRDIADYFTGYKGNNLKYNLVVITPDYSSYHNIDSDVNFRSLNSFAYYTLRAFYFTRPGGTVFSIIPSNYEQDVRNAFTLLNNAEIKITKSNDYSIIEIQNVSE